MGSGQGMTWLKSQSLQSTVRNQSIPPCGCRSKACRSLIVRHLSDILESLFWAPWVVWDQSCREMEWSLRRRRDTIWMSILLPRNLY